jgi:hypothetical protein
VFNGSPRLPTADICDRLNSEHDLPFKDYRYGKGIDGVELSNLLKPFGIRPDQFRLDGEKVRGYDVAEFQDVWARYLDPNAEPVFLSKPQPEI